MDEKKLATEMDWLQQAMDEKKLATEMAAVTTSNGREEVGDETRFDRVKRC